jgi:hypothetical protein
MNNPHLLAVLVETEAGTAGHIMPINYAHSAVASRRIDV